MSSSFSSPSSTPSKSMKLPVPTPNSKPLTTQTPDKPQLPRRRCNRNVALSLKEVRKVALSGSSQTRNDPVSKSARRQISSWPDQPSPSAKKTRKPAFDSLPERYEMLAEFFDCLDSSIRLSRLKGSMSSFTNISPKIESLTNRRFTHGHLAQLKHILPEAIEIKRVLKLDDRTCCMKPDLHVSINVDALKCDGKLKSESKNMNLRKIFRSRLADFYKAHPEGDDIPEGVLPEPFNRSKKDLSSGMENSSASLPPNETLAGDLTGQRFTISPCVEALVHDEQQRPAAAAHLRRPFRRHFSQKVARIASDVAHQDSTDIYPQQPVPRNPGSCVEKISSTEETKSSTTSTVEKLSSKPSSGEECPSPSAPSVGVAGKTLTETPSKEMLIHGKLISTPSVMCTTPGLQTPKRCYMSPDEDTFSSPNKLVRRPRARSLTFDTPVKNAEAEKNEIGDLSVDDDESKIFPESLLQSIKEKERKAKEEQDPAISRAKWRRQMIACLPKLFNMIHFFFQSIKQSVITKQELMHKLIASHFDIVDTREVEEQLNLLLELVPEWISAKLTSGGDQLLCINKMSSPETIRARLEEAK